MRYRGAFLLFCVIALVTFVGGETTSKQLPCEYSGGLLHSQNGKVVWFKSDEMKERATRKVDVSASFKQFDIKGNAIVDVLVGSSGKVICLKTVHGHPIIRSEVEKFLREWTFRTESVAGKAVAYLGEMEFFFCNINCGDSGTSMTLLK